MARFHDSQEIFSDGTASEKGRERGASSEEWEEPEGGSIAGRSGGGHPNRQLVGGRKSQKGRPSKAPEVVDKTSKSAPPFAPPAQPPRKNSRPAAPREDLASGTSSGDSSGELSDGNGEDEDNDDDDEEGEARRAKKRKKLAEVVLPPPKRPKKKERGSTEDVLSLADAVRRSASPDFKGKKKEPLVEVKGKPKGKQVAKKKKLVLSISSDDDDSDDDTEDEDDPLFRGLPALARRKLKGRYKKKADLKYKKKLQKVGLILIKSSSR